MPTESPPPSFPTSAGCDDLLFLVHVVLVALDVAASALQGGRWLEHVPQRLGAGLAVGGEMVECGNELVALVADVAGLLSNGKRLNWKLWLLLAFSLVGIQDLYRDGGTSHSCHQDHLYSMCV